MENQNHDKILILEGQLNTLIDMVKELKDCYKELPEIELKIVKLEMEIEVLKREIEIAKQEQKREIEIIKKEQEEKNKKTEALIKWVGGIVSSIIVAAVLVWLGLK